MSQPLFRQTSAETLVIRQYRIIGQERFASKFCVLTRRGFAITLSMCINFLAVTLSVLGLLNPTTGALVHNAGSCFVVLIAALLYDRKFE